MFEVSNMGSTFSKNHYYTVTVSTSLLGSRLEIAFWVFQDPEEVRKNNSCNVAVAVHFIFICLAFVIMKYPPRSVGITE